MKLMDLVSRKMGKIATFFFLSARYYNPRDPRNGVRFALA